MKRLFLVCVTLATVISSCMKTDNETITSNALTEDSLVEVLSGIWADADYYDDDMKFTMNLSSDGTCSIDLVSFADSEDAATKTFQGTWHPVIEYVNSGVQAGFEWVVASSNNSVRDVVMLETDSESIEKGIANEDFYLDFNRDVICGLYDLEPIGTKGSPYIKSTKWYKVKDLGNMSLGSWMSSIPDSRKVCNMSIPGTHDTFTFNGSLLLDALVMTQLLNIEGQWLAGVRCFDVRINTTIVSSLQVCHGPVNLMSLSSALSSINSMLVQHPSETAIVILNIMTGSQSDKAKTNINNAVKSAFGSRIADWRPDITLGEARGKAIILYRYDLPSSLQPLGPSLHGFGNNNYGQSLSMRKSSGELSAPLWVQDYFSGSGSANSYWSAKKSMMTENFRYMASLTSSNNPQNVWAINHTSGYVTLVNYCKNSGEMNPWAANYISSNPHQLTGIVTMDFAGVNVHFNLYDTKCHRLPAIIVSNN